MSDNKGVVSSNPLYSPTKAAREWAQRRGRADDAMLIEAWTTGWNARCIPEEPGALADHLRSMLLDGTVQCPLCGKTGPHPHSPEEIVIYRNGVKYGRSLKSASDETCEWCTAGVPRSKDGARHDSIYGVWACRTPAQKANSCAYCEAGMQKVKEDLHYDATNNSSHRCTSVSE